MALRRAGLASVPLVVLAAAFGLPIAAGQVGEPDLTLQVAQVDPLARAGQSTPILVTVSASCPALAASADPTTPGTGVVVVEFEAASGLFVAGRPRVDVPLDDCASGALRAQAVQRYDIIIPLTAPGLQAIPVVATGQFGRADDLSAATVPRTPASFAVTVDYLPVNQVEVARKLKDCIGGQTEFHLELTNLGNARTHYTFALSDEPGGDWTAVLPDVLLLDSPNSGAGASKATTTFTVFCPDGQDSGKFELTITPSATDDATKTGEPLIVQVLAQPTLVGVPATPAPVLALLLVALAAVAARNGR